MLKGLALNSYTNSHQLLSEKPSFLWKKKLNKKLLVLMSVRMLFFHCSSWAIYMHYGTNEWLAITHCADVYLQSFAPQAMTCLRSSDATAATWTRSPLPTDRCHLTLYEWRKGEAHHCKSDNLFFFPTQQKKNLSIYIRVCFLHTLGKHWKKDTFTNRNFSHVGEKRNCSCCFM